MATESFDQLLVAKLRTGNAEAWYELVARFEGRLLAFVRARLADKSVCEDLVQETFVGFHTALPNYDDRTPLESFLFAIASHKLADHLRRTGQRVVLSLSVDDDSGGGSEGEPSASRLVGRGRRASAVLQSHEGHARESRVLEEGLRSLVADWHKRQEFERLRCMELVLACGWPNQRVATHLGISEQAVANHKHYVLTQLREWVRRHALPDANFPNWGLGE